jgi:hypothetical protein
MTPIKILKELRAPIASKKQVNRLIIPQKYLKNININKIRSLSDWTLNRNSSLNSTLITLK